MSSSPPSSPATPRIVDSPWFWLMLFCAAAVAILIAMSPRYAARQRRLEMQYMAREEIVRRQAAGESAVREPGQEGDAPPPAPGELLVPLWPLALLLAVLFAVSGALLWRSQRLSAQRTRDNLSGGAR
jgi:hypothetical protein